MKINSCTDQESRAENLISMNPDIKISHQYFNGVEPRNHKKGAGENFLLIISHQSSVIIFSLNLLPKASRAGPGLRLDLLPALLLPFSLLFFELLPLPFLQEVGHSNVHDLLQEIKTTSKSMSKSK